MSVKLYSISDSPPTLAVRMALKYLDVEHELVNVDYPGGELLTDSFKEINPQGEVPVLDDDGFVLTESLAILQYLADKYKKDDTFYPEDVQERAIVNHRLAFHLSSFYKAIMDYMALPLLYAYPRTEENLKKMNHQLGVLNEILKRQDKPYAAGENVTIADLALVMGLVCLEAMDFDTSPYETVTAFYDNFKESQVSLWEVAVQGLEELKAMEQNPPDLSALNHPIHPTDKSVLSAE